MKQYTIQDVKNLETQFGVNLKDLKSSMQKGKQFACPACKNTGEINSKPCPICGGVGMIDTDTQGRLQVKTEYSLK